jgi:hypothetical protein
MNDYDGSNELYISKWEEGPHIGANTRFPLSLTSDRPSYEQWSPLDLGDARTT